MAEEAPPPKPTRTAIIDLIVLVFSRSMLRDLVGTDALRSVLNGSQRELFPDNDTLALQPVWELLESQANFDREKAVPPMCRIKLLEERLGVAVTMPDFLEVFDRETIETGGRECRIESYDVEKVLVPPPVPSTAKVIETISISAPAEATRKSNLAAFAAAIGLAAAGVSAYLTLGRDTGPSDEATVVPPAEITSEIPLREIRLADGAMIGVLSDGTWAQKSEEDRRRHLVAAAPAVRSHGAVTFTVVDQAGLPVGSLTASSMPTVVFAKMPFKLSR